MFGFLVRTASGVVAFAGQFFTPLQSMDRNSGKNLYACLSNLSGVSLAAEKFGIKVRSTCADQASYNNVAEKLMQQSRSGWYSAQWFCDVHAVAGTHDKCFEQLFPSQFRGLLHAALGLRVAHSWVNFKRAIIDEIDSRPVEIVLASSCRPRSLQYKMDLLQLLCENSPGGMEKATRLFTVFNGDWTAATLQFVWNPQLGDSPSIKQIKWFMVRSLFSAVCSSRPHVWPRHRWTGFRAAIRPFLLLSAIHHLLQGIFPRFMALMGQPVHTINPGHSSEGSAAAQPLVLPALASEAAAHHGSEEVGMSMDEQHPAFGSDPAVGIATTHAERNAKDRAEAQKWLQCESPHHLEVLTLFAITLQPLHKLLEEHLHMASADWEKAQCHHVKAAMVAGEEAQRKYRVQIAADMELEEKFFKTLRQIYDNTALWSLLPDTAATSRFRGQSFILLSRMGCSIEATLCHRHRQFPCRLFRLLSDPGCGQSLAAEPPCLKDAYSLALLHHYPGYGGQELLCILRLQASQQKVDISMLEALHASVRRQVCVRSCQTWTPAFQHISAEWFMQHWRKSGSKKVRRRATHKQV
eukprot:3949828-Amphidinium_carterae.2